MGHRQLNTAEPIKFGKHKGTPWREVDRNYLQWVVENINCDRWKALAKRALSQTNPQRIEKRKKNAEIAKKIREKRLAESPVDAVVYADRDFSMPVYDGPVDPNAAAPWEDDTLDREFEEIVAT